MRKITFTWISVFLFVTGCAGHIEKVQNKLEQQNTSYIGRHKDEVLKSKGVPDLQTKLSTGEDVWTYRSTKTGEAKGWSASISTGDAKPARRPLVSWTETVTFIIGTDGIVKDVSVHVE